MVKVPLGTPPRPPRKAGPRDKRRKKRKPRDFKKTKGKKRKARRTKALKEESQKHTEGKKIEIFRGGICCGPRGGTKV